ncbi:hypothetical protein Prum_067430 [Phytohabitans rumicis]|uniref:Uncharacterized protein n=1 Tax=Phytohabitans rumicis TaxID=1076125 RepID=A0A6V8LE71_9ACTN|nr:hypothetical protein Prum_067430 [Phytohabitans rumicis]
MPADPQRLVDRGIELGGQHDRNAQALGARRVLIEQRIDKASKISSRRGRRDTVVTADGEGR